MTLINRFAAKGLSVANDVGQAQMSPHGKKVVETARQALNPITRFHEQIRDPLSNKVAGVLISATEELYKRGSYHFVEDHISKASEKTAEEIYKILSEAINELPVKDDCTIGDFISSYERTAESYQNESFWQTCLTGAKAVLSLSTSTAIGVTKENKDALINHLAKEILSPLIQESIRKTSEDILSTTLNLAFDYGVCNAAGQTLKAASLISSAPVKATVTGLSRGYFWAPRALKGLDATKEYHIKRTRADNFKGIVGNEKFEDLNRLISKIFKIPEEKLTMTTNNTVIKAVDKAIAKLYETYPATALILEKYLYDPDRFIAESKKNR